MGHKAHFADSLCQVNALSHSHIHMARDPPSKLDLPTVELRCQATLDLLFTFPFFNMSIDSNAKRDMVTLMMDFENGDLDDQQTIELFQQLIDSGTVWHLQGFYGQMASELIRNGYCQLSEPSHRNAYGNTVPSREAAENIHAHQTSGTFDPMSGL